MSAAGAASLDVLTTVGEAEAQVVSLASGAPGEISVTVRFEVGERLSL